MFNNILLMSGASSSSSSNISIVVSSNTVGFNALTEAVALGFNNSLTDDRTITVTINSGVTLDGSLGAFQSGAIQQNTTLNVINNGTITGANGTTGSGGSNGVAGGTGVIYSTVVGGTATHSFTNNGTINGGGGGGGSFGRTTTAVDDGDGGTICEVPTRDGTAGSAGASGQAGASGSFSGLSNSNDRADCTVFSPGSGGAGGAAIQKQGRTVSFTNNGTVNGLIVA